MGPDWLSRTNKLLQSFQPVQAGALEPESLHQPSKGPRLNKAGRRTAFMSKCSMGPLWGISAASERLVI